jgi:hypothetical protein
LRAQEGATPRWHIGHVCHVSTGGRSADAAWARWPCFSHNRRMMSGMMSTCLLVCTCEGCIPARQVPAPPAAHANFPMRPLAADKFKSLDVHEQKALQVVRHSPDARSRNWKDRLPPHFTVTVEAAVIRGCKSLGGIENTVFSQRVVFAKCDAGCARGRGRGYLSLSTMRNYCESGALGGGAEREKRARS